MDYLERLLSRLARCSEGFRTCNLAFDLPKRYLPNFASLGNDAVSIFKFQPEQTGLIILEGIDRYLYPSLLRATKSCASYDIPHIPNQLGCLGGLSKQLGRINETRQHCLFDNAQPVYSRLQPDLKGTNNDARQPSLPSIPCHESHHHEV